LQSSKRCHKMAHFGASILCSSGTFSKNCPEGADAAPVGTACLSPFLFGAPHVQRAFL
jgi:hypothetical protein